MQFEVRYINGAHHVVAATWPKGWIVSRRVGSGNEIAIWRPPSPGDLDRATLSILIRHDGEPKVVYRLSEPIGMDRLGMLVWFLQRSAPGSDVLDSIEQQICAALFWPEPDEVPIEENLELISGDVADGFELYELIEERHPLWMFGNIWKEWCGEMFPDVFEMYYPKTVASTSKGSP